MAVRPLAGDWRNGTQALWLRLTSFYIIALPFFGFSFFNIAGRGLARPDWLIGLLLLALFVLESLRGRIKVGNSPVNLFMLLYLASGVMSGVMVLGAASLAPFIDFFTKVMQLFLVTPTFFVLSSLSGGEKTVQRLLKTWVMTGFVIALHTIYQVVAQIFDLPFASFTLTNPSISVTQGRQSARTIFGYTQPTSIFQEPSYLAAFLGPCLILLIVFVLEQRSHELLFKRTWQNWLALLAMAVAVFLSNSQAVLVGLVMTLLFLFGRGLVRRTRILKLLLSTIVVALLVNQLLQLIGIDFLKASFYRYQYLLLNILDRSTTQVTSFADRYQGIEIGVEIWRQYPLLGIGLGNLAYYNPLERVGTNNAWVQLLVEQGIIGFVALLAVFGTLAWQLTWLLRRTAQQTFWRAALIAMLCILVLTMIDGLFTFNWVDPLRIFVLAMAHLVYLQAADHRWHHQPPTRITAQPVAAGKGV